MTVGIYGIFNSDNNDCLYVGSSSNIEYRWKQHIRLLKSGSHSCTDFANWYSNVEKNYLLDFRILEKCEDNDISKNILEIFWFKKLSPKYYGKEPSINEKWKHSEETKKKIAEISKEKHHNKIDVKREKIIEMSLDFNLSTVDMAKELSISAKALRKYLKVEGIVNHYKKIVSKKEHAKVLEMYFEEKMSTREIAKHFNCSQPNIIQIFKQYENVDKRFLKVEEKRHLRFSGQEKARDKKLINKYNRVPCEKCSNSFGTNVIKRHMEACV